MRNVTVAFKNNIKKYGRQLDAKISANGINLTSEFINNINYSFNTQLFKTVMHVLEIDSNVMIPAQMQLNAQVGIKFNSEYEYIDLGQYKVKKCNKKEDTISYDILAYDRMIESMIDYDLQILEKITVREYLIKVCQRLGWNTNNIPAVFINSDKLVDPSLHIGIGYTFRDVLDEIATITCSFLYFKGNDFYLSYVTETNEKINEEYLDENNVTIGEKYFINSLVFSRAEESDNIYRKDNESIEKNGVHEYKISDNQLLSTNDRDLYIEDMFSYLKTFEFYLYDVQSKGILFLGICDRFKFNIRGQTYSTILLNNEINITQGLEEKLYIDKIEGTETDYKYADTTDKKINQTYILVDKQNQKITQLISNQTEFETKLTKQEQDINGLKQEVANTVDYKRETQGYTEIHLVDSGEQNILKLEINGNKTYETNLYPRPNLYPRANLHSNQKGG